MYMPEMGKKPTYLLKMFLQLGMISELHSFFVRFHFASLMSQCRLTKLNTQGVLKPYLILTLQFNKSLSRVLSNALGSDNSFESAM